MKRREFMAGLAGVAAWPEAALAQQGERLRRIAVLMNLAADDAEGQGRVAGRVSGGLYQQGLPAGCRGND